MATKGIGYIRQCPDCRTLVEDTGKGRAAYVPSIATIPGVPQVQCHTCKQKSELPEKTDDMTINGITPFAHQARAVEKFKSVDQILAHEMGLGKTLTSAFIGYGDRSLVVCPAKLKKSRVKELSLLGIESVQVIETGKDEITDAQWIIASYDIASTIYDRLLEQKFDHLFLDESHYIKGKFRQLKTERSVG